MKLEHREVKETLVVIMIHEPVVTMETTEFPVFVSGFKSKLEIPKINKY